MNVRQRYNLAPDIPGNESSTASQKVFKPLLGEVFHFSCNKDLTCFTRCCAKLRLILTPYDIVRMKNRLGLCSDHFLELYTDTVIEDHSRFPMLQLKMRDGEKRICPFVTKEGCTIYEDRPGACRLYPLGRGSTMVEGEKKVREKFFIVDETHCLGIKQQKPWTLKEWLEHEGVNKYTAMNDQWLEIIGSSKKLGTKNAAQKFQMFSMASYNLDKFREFVFKSRFLDIFEVDLDLKEKLAGDDIVLMKFAFDWLKFSLFGDNVIKLKARHKSS